MFDISFLSSLIMLIEDRQTTTGCESREWCLVWGLGLVVQGKRDLWTGTRLAGVGRVGGGGGREG